MPGTPDGTGPLLAVRDLRVAFHGAATAPVVAVDGVSFDLERGETLGVVGESGCGKSATALALMGLLPAAGRVSGGRALLAGASLFDQPEAAWRAVRGARMAMVFQEPATALNPVFSIGDQVAEPLRIHRRAGRRDARRAAADMLSRVGLPDPARIARLYPHQLSGGMRQRAMIAMALICHPEVLIADEPTTALDVTVQAQILDVILDIQREMGTAVLFIGHDLAVVSELADRVAVMYAGRIVEQAPAAGLFAEPLHPYTRALLASRPGRGAPGARLPTIPGALPDPAALPGGCRFAARCPRADDWCRVADPALRPVGPGHRLACTKVAP